MNQDKEMQTLLSESDIEGLEQSQYNLRPQSLDEFIGQEQIKEQLRIHIEAAKSRKQALAHILFVGPPDWVRQHWLGLLPMRWEAASSQPLVLRWNVWT